MNLFGKVVSYNLLAFLVYGAFYALIAGLEQASFGVLGISMVHAFGCMIAAIVYYRQKDKERGGGFVVSMFILFIVGLSYCFGVYAASGANFLH